MDLTTILNILIEHNLTADELLLIYLTFLARDEENHSEYFTKWYDNGGQERLEDLYKSLQKKGVILKNYNPSGYNPNDIEFNSNFIKRGIKNSMQLGQELFDAYEPFLNIRGRYVPLRNISKNFCSLKDFFFHYSSTINHSVEKHKEVLEILKGARENKRITFTILEGVASHKGEDMKLMRDSTFEGETSDTFDFYESI